MAECVCRGRDVGMTQLHTFTSGFWINKKKEIGLHSKQGFIIFFGVSAFLSFYLDKRKSVHKHCKVQWCTASKRFKCLIGNIPQSRVA